MTTLVLVMGKAKLEARVPIPKRLVDGGGERVFAPTKREAQVNGERQIELSAMQLGLELRENL